VKGMRKRLAGLLEPNATFSLEIRRDVPLVLGDPSQIEQMLGNVVVNAGEALEGRPGKVAVHLSRAIVDPGHPCEFVTGTHCPDGEYACFEVTDDGVGMDAETRLRIFDPFYTTRFTGRGLGLSAALGIVRAHGGGIALESEPGRGSRFRLMVPAAPASAPVAAAPPARGPRRMVLVVDDERAVRELACSALERAGFEVLSAPDGASALELWDERRADIALVLADVSMPHMGGEHLLAEIRRRDANAAVVLMSGGAPDGTPAGEGPGFTAWLGKPYRLAELVAMARRFAGPPR